MPVDAAAGRGAAGAEEEAGAGGAVEPRGGADGDLPWGHGAAADVAAEEVGVPGFEGGGAHGVAGEDAVAETGGEALDLLLDSGGGVAAPVVGDVAVGPCGVASFAVADVGGGAGGVDDRGLDEDEIGAGVPVCRAGPRGGGAVPHGALAGGDFGERAADVDAAGAAGCGVGPGDWAAEGPVDFEGAGAAAEAAQEIGEAGGEVVFGELEQAGGGEVAEDEVGGADFGERADADAGVERAAVGAQAGGEGVRDGLCAAGGDGPAYGVRGGAEDECDGGAGGVLERQHGVAGHAGEQGAGGLALEEALGEEVRGLQGVDAEAGEQKGVPREVDGRAEELGGELLPVVDERLEELAVGGGVVGVELVGCFDDGAVQDDGLAGVDGVGEGEVGVEPGEAVALEAERAEDGRGRAHGEGA